MGAMCASPSSGKTASEPDVDSMNQHTVDQQSTGWRSNRGSAEASNGGQLARMLLDGLGVSTVVLGGLYLLFALGHLQYPAPIARILVPMALLTALAMFGIFGVVHRRNSFSPMTGHVLSGLVAALVLANSLVHLGVTGDPLQTTNLILLLVGAGFLFLSIPMLVVLIVVTLAGWLILAGPALALPTWRHFGFALLSGAALGLILQATRLRTYRHLEALRDEAEMRAQMLRQRARHLETLITVGHSITTFLDLDALLEHVVETVQEAFGYDYVGVFLTDESGRYLDARAGTGEAGRQLIAEGCRLEVGKAGLVGWASGHREPVCVNRVDEDSRYVKADVLSNTQSELALPLEMGDRLLGVLDVQCTRPDAFGEEDLRVCRSLADQISTAIVNASRYQLEHARRSLTETLCTVGRALSQTLDVSEVLDLILTSLARILAFDRGSVLLEREGMVETVAALGFPGDSDPLSIRVPIKEGDVYDRIRQTGAPLVLPEVAERADWEHVDKLPPARSWAGLPLTDTDGRVIGMLSLVREEPNPYTEDEVALGTAFAGQAGIALHNARLYMELSEAYRQLSHLDRAKSNFIAVASHELRTPLTLISGYSHMLYSELKAREDSELTGMIEGVSMGAARLQEIVDRMMDLAEIETDSLRLEFAPANLGLLVRDVISGFTEALDHRQLHVDLGDVDALPEVEIDLLAISKVLRQLVMNAIKYTPDGGSIRISGTDLPSGGSGVAEPAVEITVADTGVGIDPAQQERIFQKFSKSGEITLHSSGSVKFQGGGPGLGLAIVRGILEAHRGRVWVESPGHDPQSCPGSTFHVTLPHRQIGLDPGRGPASAGEA